MTVPLRVCPLGPSRCISHTISHEIANCWHSQTRTYLRSLVRRSSSEYDLTPTPASACQRYSFTPRLKVSALNLFKLLHEPDRGV